MKFKHVISTLALATVTAFGLASGLRANPVKEVKADGGDTWGFGVVLNAATIPDSYRSDCNNFRFGCWGTGVTYEEYEMHETGADYVFSVNCSFNASQTITGGKFIFNQNGSGDKTSVDLSFGYGPTSDFFGFMSWRFNGTWDGDKWEVGTSQSWTRAQIDYYDTELVEHNAEFTYDPVHNYFHFDNLVINSANHYKAIQVLFGGSWDYTYRILLDNDAIFSGDGAWFEVAEEGTYDIYILNEYQTYLEDKGILVVKKHVEEESYIYYATQSSEESNDWIYTYNSITDTKQFGDWPGKKISNLENVTKYFADSNDFKFCGSDGSAFNRIVYKIPVNIGHPGQDKVIIHNNSNLQTSNMDLEAHSTYFWKDGSDFRNMNSTVALEFLLDAEELRNSVENSSVCNISKTAAETLYTRYLSLTVPQKALVDGSSVWTWKEDKSGEMGDVSYGRIMYRIGVIAEMVSTSVLHPFGMFGNNGGTIALIIIISAVSIATVGGIVVFRKRKEK